MWFAQAPEGALTLISFMLGCSGLTPSKRFSRAKTSAKSSFASNSKPLRSKSSRVTTSATCHVLSSNPANVSIFFFDFFFKDSRVYEEKDPCSAQTPSLAYGSPQGSLALQLMGASAPPPRHLQPSYDYSGLWFQFDMPSLHLVWRAHVVVA